MKNNCFRNQTVSNQVRHSYMDKILRAFTTDVPESQRPSIEFKPLTEEELKELKESVTDIDVDFIAYQSLTQELFLNSSLYTAVLHRGASVPVNDRENHDPISCKFSHCTETYAQRRQHDLYESYRSERGNSYQMPFLHDHSVYIREENVSDHSFEL